MTHRPEIVEMLYWVTNPKWLVFDPSEEYQYRLTDEAPPRTRAAFDAWYLYRKEHPGD